MRMIAPVIMLSATLLTSAALADTANFDNLRPVPRHPVGPLPKRARERQIGPLRETTQRPASRTF
jgi:hypothetical protein